MFLRTTGRRIVVAGGGEQAAQKVRLVAKTDAEIVLLADRLDPELAGVVSRGGARHVRGPITPDAFRDAALVFIATGSPGADMALHALAREAGAIVNVVDRPELCDATTPSIVDRDPLVVAIGTEGTAPVLGRQVKTRIETLLDPDLGPYAALAGRLRAAVARRVPRAARRGFWQWAFAGPARAAHRRGDVRGAEAMLERAIAAGGAVAGGTGRIAFVGTGPGARDLLTLRAVQRMQEADAIFVGAGVVPDVLELARRDAERIDITDDDPADLAERLAEAIAEGGCVVRLVAGEPSRACAGEIARLAALGLVPEIVPGVAQEVPPGVPDVPSEDIPGMPSARDEAR